VLRAGTAADGGGVLWTYSFATWDELWRDPRRFWPYFWLTLNYAVGLGLMFFYIMSARRMVSRGVNIAGWLVSALYNFIPWGLFLYMLAATYAAPPGLAVLIMLALLIWPTLAIIFSARALSWLGADQP